MNKVTICGVDTSSLPKLSRAESDNLLERIEKGDETAKELFLRAVNALREMCEGDEAEALTSFADVAAQILDALNSVVHTPLSFKSERLGHNGDCQYAEFF